MENLDGSESSRDELDLRLLDLQVREALEPPPEAVERIVRNALSLRRPVRRFQLVPALPILATLALVAGLLVLAPHLSQRARREVVVSIENVGDLMVVHHPGKPGKPGEQVGQEEGRWVIHNSGPEESAAPSRSLIVIYYENGDKP
jgi:hypothetical protein